MTTAAITGFTDQKKWLAIIARNCELGLERIDRRAYLRRHKRYDIEFGQARVEFGPDPITHITRCPEHMTVLEVSTEGVMLRGYEDIPSDTAVKLFVNIAEDGAMLRGVIRHTTMTLGGYKIGIQLQF